MAKDESATIVGMPRELVELLFERLGAATPQMDPAQLAEILKATGLTTAAAMQKALKPENAQHPGISCFSYPEGDLAKPRPELKCKMSWVGAPIDSGNNGTMHWFELELLNQVAPGVYTVTNADMTLTQLTVEGTRDPAGAIESLAFRFPLKNSEKNNVSPMAVWLLEALGRSYMDAMSEWLRVHIEDKRAKSAPQMVAA